MLCLTYPFITIHCFKVETDYSLEKMSGHIIEKVPREDTGAHPTAFTKERQEGCPPRGTISSISPKRVQLSHLE